MARKGLTWIDKLQDITQIIVNRCVVTKRPLAAYRIPADTVCKNTTLTKGYFTFDGTSFSRLLLKKICKYHLLIGKDGLRQVQTQAVSRPIDWEFCGRICRKYDVTPITFFLMFETEPKGDFNLWATALKGEKVYGDVFIVEFQAFSPVNRLFNPNVQTRDHDIMCCELKVNPYCVTGNDFEMVSDLPVAP
jgi:hypothetical protein